MARTCRRRRAAKLMAKPSGQMQKGNPDDRISSLPNGILVNILDRLDVCAAARTSVLSRRWSQLPAMLSRLTISAWDLLPSENKTSFCNAELVRMANTAVAKVTKSILARRDPGGWPIRLLSMTFYLIDDVPISVGHAVGNAMATCKVEKAEFTVLTEKGRLEFTIDDLVKYGARFVSFFNECMDTFAGLTCLYLANLRFAESDFVSNILVTCKRLKHLGFLNCDTENWIAFQIEHAELSELSIVNCRFDVVKLDWVPKLTWLVFEFWMSFKEPPLSFGYVPLLNVLSVSNVALSWHEMVEFSTFLHETSVRDLSLGFKCEKIWVQPECLTRWLASVFHQLRIVNLVDIPEGYDLTWTMFILEAAPSLEEFYMTVMDHPCDMQMDQEKRKTKSYSEHKGVEWESPASNFKHHRLTKLIIFCFQSEDYMVSHVRRVLKAAVNLGDVYLYDRLTCSKCRGVEPLNLIRFPETSKHRCWVEKQIRRGIESLATIHFLTTAKIREDYVSRIV
ncbi:F-box/FBD/LRR-repeat protein At3g26920-like [Triticum dicoccoides]|uniref:F-box/FBD/LRR-repeat protein At3g26920-like n=1 Tax=Triticum dicoccoides TaxID=85692 RepID=UPI001890EF7D|nr:F-box/FBD/LRR-repeat protein At3g26920-like [Triticum dicoccoides]